MSDLGTGFRNVALTAAGGAAFGAGTAALSNPQGSTSVGQSAMYGASAGAGAATIGGLVVALVSPRLRNKALATSGVGLGALILTSIAMQIATPSSSAALP
jgi:hypothetical protein